MYNDLMRKEILIAQSKELISKIKVTPSQVNSYFQSIVTTPMENSETIEKLVRRPEVSLKKILEISRNGNAEIDITLNDNEILEQVEIETKYSGYIQRQLELIEKMDKLEEMLIPLNFNYSNLKSISTEGREKLSKVKPRSIAQASRISGVTHSDISVLLVYLKR
jgi:tRNA uridine 5-carboxymethylaminomethyl modification enzyme